MAGRIENLKPKTSPQARGKLGGIKSVQVRKEKKLMSQIFAELLSNGLEDDITKAAPKIIRKCGAPAVSLMKTIAEVTEGHKLKTETVLTINTDDEKVAAILVEYGINKPEPKN